MSINNNPRSIMTTERQWNTCRLDAYIYMEPEKSIEYGIKKNNSKTRRIASIFLKGRHFPHYLFQNFTENCRRPHYVVCILTMFIIHIYTVQMQTIPLEIKMRFFARNYILARIFTTNNNIERPFAAQAETSKSLFNLHSAIKVCLCFCWL